MSNNVNTVDLKKDKTTEIRTDQQGQVGTAGNGVKKRDCRENIKIAKSLYQAAAKCFEVLKEINFMRDGYLSSVSNARHYIDV